MTPSEHLSKAEAYFAQFKANKSLLSASHSDFLYHCAEAAKGFWSKAQQRDIAHMMEAVVHAQGIPGAMYGNHPMFRENDFFRLNPRNGKPYRDHNGRWCCDPDMIENDKPVVIDWAKEEDRAWELTQEYVDAFREAMSNV